MVDHGGSQCGYCTPGFVVSMFAEFYRRGRDGFEPESIAGNLCRCTGYRPIRDAAAALPLPEPGDPFLERLSRPAPDVVRVSLVVAGRRFHRPTTLSELFDARAEHPSARLVAGGTDLIVEMNQNHVRHETVIAIDAVEELHVIERRDDAVEVGAAVPLSRIEDELGAELPILGELLPLFSSRLIRNRATLGGNLVNASPIGDSPPVLLALDAVVRVVSAEGEREVELASFFTGYRRTVLAPNELVRSIVVPLPLATHARFYKVSKRELDDISTVAAAFAITTGSDGTIDKARLAYGGVAATPARATAAEAALVGRRWDGEAAVGVRAELATAFTPMTDHRGSAAYRTAMVTRLFEKFVAETTSPAG
jgi:xanthine dehydrogenase small subunit